MPLLKDYFYSLIGRYCSVFVRPSDRVLFVDPRSDLLAESIPAQEKLIVHHSMPASSSASASLESAQGWDPDYVVLNGNVHYEGDILDFMKKVRRVCSPDTRVILMYYSSLWRPIMRAATELGWRQAPVRQNWTTPDDVENFARLSGFEQIKREQRVLAPIPGLGHVLNRWLTPLPVLPAALTQGRVPKMASPLTANHSPNPSRRSRCISGMVPSAIGPTLSSKLPFLLTMSTKEWTSSSTDR